MEAVEQHAGRRNAIPVRFCLNVPRYDCGFYFTLEIIDTVAIDFCMVRGTEGIGTGRHRFALLSSFSLVDPFSAQKAWEGSRLQALRCARDTTVISLYTASISRHIFKAALGPNSTPNLLNPNRSPNPNPNRNPNPT